MATEIRISCTACGLIVDFDNLGKHFKTFCNSARDQKEEMIRRFNQAYLLKADFRHGNLTEDEYITEVRKHFK